MSLLQAEEISVRIGPHWLLQDADFTANAGDHIGLVGPNGCGKSTLFKVLKGTLELDGGTLRRQANLRVGLLSQDLAAESEISALQTVLDSTPGRRELEEEGEALQSKLEHATDAETQSSLAEALAEWSARLGEHEATFGEHRAKAVLTGLGFTQETMLQPLSTLSGGWRMRAHLGALLHSRPGLLLLDEPTNHLDLPSTRWLSSYLRSYPQTFVLISHDPALLDACTSRTWAFHSGRLREYEGGFSTYRRRFAEEQADRAKKKEAQEKLREKEQAFIDRFRAKATKAKAVQARIKKLERLESVEELESHSALHFSFPEPTRIHDRVAAFENLKVAYGTHVVFEGLEGAVQRGSRIALVGPNGSGKTSLLKALAEVLAPTAGSIEFAHGCERGYFAQDHIDALSPDETPIDAVQTHAPKASITEVRSLLGALGIRGEHSGAAIGTLSGGQRARVALAQLLTRASHLLLLDEPTNHLDLWAAEGLGTALSAYPGTLIFVSHHQEFIRQLATEVWHLEGGRLRRFPGGFDEYLSAVEAPQESAGAPSSVSNSTQKESAKDRRRREAQARAELQKTLGPLKKRLDRIQEELDAAEQRHAKIETWMGEVGFFQREDAPALSSEYNTLGDTIAQLMEDWEALASEIEAIETTAS